MLSDELTAAFSLEGRVAIVTGAGRGIGAEIARTLEGAGATVVRADVAPGDQSVRQVDVSSRAEVDALELLMPAATWPLPKYREMLFLM